MAGLVAAAAAVLLGLCTPAALATTGEPELLGPESFSVYRSPLSIEYTLPEDAATGSALLTFVPTAGAPTTVTLTAGAGTKGTHSFLLDVHNLAGNPTFVKEASKASLADGEYTVALSYQNVAKEPAATALAEEVQIKTVTAPPALSAPLASSTHSSPLTVQYTLPEESSIAGATLEFVPSKGGTPTALTMTSAASTQGSHSVSLDLHALEASVGVEEASKPSLADGEYTVKVSYEDELENVAASAEATGVKIKTATAAPTLSAPVGAGSYGGVVPVEYTLAEGAGTGSAKLEFKASGGSTTTLTLTASASTAGTHKFSIAASSPGSDATDVAAVTGGPIAGGLYTVKLSYQDALLNPAASAEATGVSIKTATGAPTLSEPLTGHAFWQPFAVSYSLPEAALAGSVQIVLVGVNVGTETITLTNAAAGAHTVQIAPAHPNTEPGIAAAPAELPADQYQLVVRYQDGLGNPAASSSAVTIRLTKGPACKTGTYSATGEAPCTEAPAGSFAGEEGLTGPTECAAGRYAPEKGLANCLPASPGSYVESPGATSQRPCPPGSFAAASGTTKCAATPANTYASGGAITPTPCPSGTTSAAGASACSASAKTAGRFASETATPQGPAANSPALGGTAAKVTVKIASAKRPDSLRQARRQRYVLVCSAAAKVSVQVSAVVRDRKKLLTVKAGTRTASCAAGKRYEGVASFKLTPAARALLAQPGASVRLTVRVFATGAAGHGRLASSVLRGRA